MIDSYISKTRLAKNYSKTREDKLFETLIRGVGRLKSLRIILETIVKDGKSGKLK